MTKITSPTITSATTEFHPYDPKLPRAFSEVRNIIQQEIPNARVEHIGSSSIPGVGGRNAIDMVIPAEPLEHASILPHLYTVGFQDSPFQHFRPMLIGSLTYAGKEYGLLLYLMSPDSDVYKGWLVFRDYMRMHPEDARAYEKVKQQAIAAGNIDAWSYQQAKTPFLIALADKIQKSTNP